MNYVLCDLVNESMNNDNTNQRKVKVPFDSPIEKVNIVREVNRGEYSSYLGHKHGPNQ